MPQRNLPCAPPQLVRAKPLEPPLIQGLFGPASPELAIRSAADEMPDRITYIEFKSRSHR